MALNSNRRQVLERYLLLGVLLPILVYLVAFRPDPVDYALAEYARFGIDPYRLDPDTLSPRLAKHLGLRSERPTRELVVVFISSESCSANRVSGFADAVSRLPAVIEGQLGEDPNAVVRFVGISVDNDPRVGAEYLLRLVPFDEVVAGGNWLNTATEKYFWKRSDVRQTATIPRIIVLQRTITWRGSVPTISDEILLGSVESAPTIIEWISEGATMGELK